MSVTVDKVKLTMHENETFNSDTLILSGHSYKKCTFNNCTLMVTNMPLMLVECNFRNCNWRLDYDILWSVPAQTQMIRKLLDLIDSGQVRKFSSDALH